MNLEKQTMIHSEATVEQLVRAAQHGDRRAFGRLVERYQRSVYALAEQRLGNDAEAQDLCQEVFLCAMQKIGQLRDARCFGGWLRKITQRLAINRVVRRRPEVAAVGEAFDCATATTATPLAALIVNERERQVRRGMRRLRALDRETLTAFYFDGQSLNEMSETSGSPLGTIKRRLHVARQRLADELGELAPT
jgi:RNA polymerase sigma-70 factor (ECF subfamily)